MKKITATRRRLREVYAAMKELSLHSRKAKITFALAKNIGRLRVEMEALEKANEFHKDYTKYDEKRMAAAAASSAKDKDGKPVLLGGVQYAIIDHEGMEKKLEPIRREFAEAIATREAQLEDVEEMLNEEIEVEFHQLPAEMVEEEKEDGTPAAFDVDTAGLALMVEPLFGFVIEV